MRQILIDSDGAQTAFPVPGTVQHVMVRDRRGFADRVLRNGVDYFIAPGMVTLSAPVDRGCKVLLFVDAPPQQPAIPVDAPVVSIGVAARRPEPVVTVIERRVVEARPVPQPVVSSAKTSIEVLADPVPAVAPVEPAPEPLPVAVPVEPEPSIAKTSMEVVAPPDPVPQAVAIPADTAVLEARIAQLEAMITEIGAAAATAIGGDQ